MQISQLLRNRSNRVFLFLYPAVCRARVKGIYTQDPVGHKKSPTRSYLTKTFFFQRNSILQTTDPLPQTTNHLQGQHTLFDNEMLLCVSFSVEYFVPMHCSGSQKGKVICLLCVGLAYLLMSIYGVNIVGLRKTSKMLSGK